MATQKTFYLETFGCQMNVHDSEKVIGTLRRLLAEIEMWLHAQPLNERRSRRGAASVTGLWFPRLRRL